MRHRTFAYCTILLALTVSAIGCHRQHVNNLPPAKMLMEPGPGVGGPGPGVMLGDLPAPVPYNLSQVAFVGPAGMRINWDSSGDGFFDTDPLIAPGRQNFPQGAIYRLKVTSIGGRPGEEYYPTLEVGPTTPRTEAYLAHNAIPVQFTATDFDQVQSGNFVTKVIYLPDPDYHELALAAIETLVSTRLDPGVDPIQEADRRGSILGIIRLGNKDLEIPGQTADQVAGGPGGRVVPANFEMMMAAGGGPGMGHPGMMMAGRGGPGMGPAGMMMAGRGGPGMGHPGMMMAGGGGAAMGAGGPMPSPIMGMSPSHVAGVTAPQYGMPMSGTPIGLPGPPHIPLGIPAGLQKHSIRNKTAVHMPKPTDKIGISVKQKPGYSYPKPPSRVRIVEEASQDRRGSFKQAFCDMFQWLK